MIDETGADNAREASRVADVRGSVLQANDDAFLVPADRPALLAVRVNDEGPRDASIVDLDTSETLGSIALDDDGDLVYDPGRAFADLAAEATGLDRFSYALSDGDGGVDRAVVRLIVVGEDDDGQPMDGAGSKVEASVDAPAEDARTSAAASRREDGEAARTSGREAPGEPAFFVSPDGSDAWSGLLAQPNAAGTDGPFATPARARDAMRGSDEIDTAYLRSGIFFLEETLRLDQRDAGVTFAAYPGERPVLSGGDRVDGFRDDGGGRYSAPFGGEPDLLVSVDGVRQRMAQSGTVEPDEPWISGWLFAETLADTEDRRHGDNTRFKYRQGDIDPQELVPGDWIEVASTDRWFSRVTTVADIDPVSRVVTVSEAAANYGIDEGATYRLLGKAEWLDGAEQAGFDRQGRLVIEPDDPGALIERGAVVGRLDEIIHVHDADGLRLEGLTLRDTAWNGTALRLFETDEAKILGNTVHNAGSGIGFGDGSSDNLVAGNELYDLGRIGVFFGDDRVNESNRIIGNHIHDVGISDTGGRGIGLHHVRDTVVAHNLIEDIAFHGITTGSGDPERVLEGTTIELNRLLDTVQAAHDGGAIYVDGKDREPFDAVIRHNHIDGVAGLHTNKDLEWVEGLSFGIYLDRNADGVDVEGNFVRDTNRAAVMIHGGDDITIENNIAVLGQKAEDFVQIQFNSFEPEGGRPENNIVQRNIIYGERPVDHYIRLIKPGDYEIDHNLRHQVGNPTEGDDRDGRAADPEFLAPEVGDYRLGEASPAFELGIRDLPWDRMGLAGFETDEPGSADWPVWDALLL